MMVGAERVFPVSSIRAIHCLDLDTAGPHAKLYWCEWNHPGEESRSLVDMFEGALACHWQSFIRPGSVCLDIGAHSGDTTVPMGVLAFDRTSDKRGLVIAVEPNPDVFEVLQLTLQLNGGICEFSSVRAAITRFPVEAVEISDHGNANCNGGIIDASYSASLKETLHGLARVTFTAPAFTLPAFVEEFVPEDRRSDISFIKIDCEGYDKEIIRGASDFLTDVRPAFFIEWFSLFNDEDSADLFDAIAEIGYRAIDPKTLAPADVSSRVPDLLLLPPTAVAIAYSKPLISRHVDDCDREAGLDPAESYLKGTDPMHSSASSDVVDGEALSPEPQAEFGEWQRSFAALDRTDNEQVFRFRDAMKNRLGISRTAEFFRSLLRHGPSTPAIAFNTAICELEAGASEKCRSITADLLAPGWREALDRDLRLGVISYHLLSLRDHGLEALQFYRSIQEDLTVPEREKIVSLFLDDFLRPEMLSPLLELAREQPADLGIDARGIRLLYEACSANNKLDSFYCLFDKDSERFSREASGTCAVLRLLHEDLPDHWWHEEVREVVRSGQYIAPRDAFGIGLQSIKRLGGGAAAALMNEFLSRGNEYWPCRRVLGIISEVEGNLEEAVRQYHQAGVAELGDEYASRIAPTSPANIKISCITLSFNDGPLVEPFCSSIMPHCDQIIVDDGGSTDDTVAQFEAVRVRTGFDIVILCDNQRQNQDRNLFNKDVYRSRGFGGVLGFDADRRRTATLIAADHEYILVADLDEYFPPQPNLKTVVAAGHGADQFVGMQSELLNPRVACNLFLGMHPKVPRLFKRHPKHLFAGADLTDEYLSRTDLGLAEWASRHMDVKLSYCWQFWHLKFLLDSRAVRVMEPLLGPKSFVAGRYDCPDFGKYPVSSEIAAAASASRTA